MKHSLATLWGAASVITMMLTQVVHPASLAGSPEGDESLTARTSPGFSEFDSVARDQSSVYIEDVGGSSTASSSFHHVDYFDEDEDDDGEDGFSARGRGSFASSVDEMVTEQRANFTDNCECGQKLNRIVGGQKTDISEYPWQVALVVAETNQQFCGGSLITDRHVLTAAHCFQEFSIEDFVVHLREHDLSDNSETDVLKRGVSKIFLHNDFNNDTANNDIAILKLASPVTVSSNLLPVCLPSSQRTKYSNKEAVATGWGLLSADGEDPTKLREVTVPVLSQRDCRKKTAFSPSQITDQMLCAGKVGMGVCSGDSGGPLVYRDKNDRYDQIGIVSWRNLLECEDKDSPSVFTRVNKFLGWIENRTKDGIYCKGFNFPDSALKHSSNTILN